MSLIKPGTILKLSSGRATAMVDATQGGLVTDFSVGGTRILYPDGQIDVSGRKKRRGGIPVLFPQAGALSAPPPNFNLAQHGFARDMAWEAVESPADGRRVALRLRATAETKSKFPFEFEVRAGIEIDPESLTVSLRVSNPGGVPLWTAPGLHPYFAISADSRLKLTTNVLAFDIGTYRLDESLILMPQRVDMEIPGTGRVSMIPGGEFLRPASRLVVWSDRPDYMCFEPWSAGVGSLLRPDERLEVPPGGEIFCSMRIEVATKSTR
ncbi:MAG: hypothetical protein A3G34_01675 [Candidatus Lindowbacteria bacterium RIFCSPLOWO2_12_FULL_62_27]|nr:MAG: hypothetical protein A3I06_05620 [Candidatus Lindowbacteria bacterium RIFCSPLOWO2_02_FULL_62_12]OGH59020.1 MAG: hypothetical protein A3G34_01675 [Candidatus Lindowbacteria bacterium RIFCSPLOWO2_12_FULL_62_27]